MKYPILALTVLLMLGGCASPTTYKAANDGGYGYRESQIADNRYRVAFKMRGEDSLQAMDYAMLRAAELTLMAGYDWFVVVDRHSDQDQGDSRVRADASRERVIEQDCGLLGCTTRSRPSTEVGVGMEAGEREKTEAILEIRLGKGVRPEGNESYDALEVRDNLRNSTDS